MTNQIRQNRKVVVSSGSLSSFRVVRGSGQVIADNTETSVDFTATDQSGDSIASWSSGTPDEVVVAADGYYLLTAQVGFLPDALASGDRAAWIDADDTGVGYVTIPAPQHTGRNAGLAPVYGPDFLAAGAVVKLRVFQNSGADLVAANLNLFVALTATV